MRKDRARPRVGVATSSASTQQESSGSTRGHCQVPNVPARTSFFTQALVYSAAREIVFSCGQALTIGAPWADAVRRYSSFWIAR